LLPHAWGSAAEGGEGALTDECGRVFYRWLEKGLLCKVAVGERPSVRFADTSPLRGETRLARAVGASACVTTQAYVCPQSGPHLMGGESAG